MAQGFSLYSVFMDDNSFTFDTLNEYNIFELRAIGRQVGVHLPTTYRKDVLISKILAILHGEAQPHVRQTNKGRPAKGVLMAQSSANIMNAEKDPYNEWLPASVYNASRSLYQVRSPQAGMLMDVMSQGTNKENKKLSGFVELYPEGWGVARSNADKKSNEDALVPQALVAKADLRYGDYITGLGKLNIADGHNYFSSIETINDQKAGKRCASFDSLPARHPIEKIVLKSGKVDVACIEQNSLLGFGQRCLIAASDAELVSKFLIGLAEDIEGKKADVVFVSLDKRPEDEFRFTEGSKIKQQFCGFGINPKEQLRVLEFELESAKRRAEMGGYVVLFVDGLLELMRLYNHFVENTGKEIAGGIDYGVLTLIKKFLNNAKNTAEAGNLTLIYGFSADGCEPCRQTLFSELMRVSNSTIMLDATGKVDLIKSQTTNKKLV